MKTDHIGIYIPILYNENIHSEIKQSLRILIAWNAKFVIKAISSFVSFSSCQRNLIKTFQIEGMIELITKMTLIFSSDLLNGQKWLSKKAKFFRNFRNKSQSILTLRKINKNKKVAPELIFFNEFLLDGFEGC